MTYGESALTECRHKIERAKEHDRIFYHEIRAFLDTNPYTFVPEYDEERAKYLLKLQIVKPIPQSRFALILGDLLHNARAALDYLAWRLVGSVMTDMGTYFPIYKSRTVFDEIVVKRRHLDKRVHKDAFAAIRDVQPYRATEWERDPLWLLQDLDAKDKHKLLTMTQALCIGSSFLVYGFQGGEFDRRVNYGALKDGAVLAEISFPAGTPKSEMRVNADPRVDIGFEEGVLALDSAAPISTHTHRIIQSVIDVISRFEREITDDPTWIPP